MSQRSVLQDRIQRKIKERNASFSGWSIVISELVMEVLDEFVEETDTSELRIGDRVRRLEHNPAEESIDEEYGPPLNSVGNVVGWDDDTRWPLVQFNDEFPGGHDGRSICVDEKGRKVEPELPCWYCEPTTLEKLL